jgi:DNA-binding NtrC family response regulator/HAMP domain-containing protein
MRPKSLKSSLLVAIAFFVILSGLAIALLVTQRYSAALHATLMGQSENMAHAIALEAADRILINDLVGLQKLLDQQLRSHPGIGYLFVVKEDRVLAHTLPQGVPVGLMAVNQPTSADGPAFRKISSQTGEPFLETAWPIFEGKAGVLRLGVSETYYRQQLTSLWLQIGLLTLGILLAALMGGLWFVRRITRPLATLVKATQQIDQGETNVRVPVEGQAEIARLAASFNQMVGRQEEYTHRLEEQTQELERAYGQTRAACQIVREVSALGSLKEMGEFLLMKLKDQVPCPSVSLMAFNATRDTLFVISEHGLVALRDPQVIKSASETLDKLTNVSFTRKSLIKPPLIPESFSSVERQAQIPFTDGQISGAAIIACPGGCDCHPEKMQWLGLILNQNAGALGRAMLHEEEVGGLRGRVEAASGFGEIIGKDQKMQMIYKLIEDVAPTDATVLIQGESGTGKELVARAIHQLSPRRDRPFVVINCSAYPATLLESELFGHEKGAFTGATRQKPGRFELANGGTVFLDEVGEMPPPAQIKLLRVLQTRKFERVGGEKTLSVDVRILAATNKDLLREVERGGFREDLLYRLNVIPLRLPSLKERKNDIPLLALHFLRRFAAEQRKDIREISSEAMRLLLEYPWSGNVRELENSLEHAVVLAKGSRLEAWDLPATLRQQTASVPPTMEDRELQILLEILRETGWNKKLAAQRLGISRSTVYAILKRHQVSKPDPTTH